MNEAVKCRHELMKEIQITTFEAIETNLFLDTHPFDREAMNALRKYESDRNRAIDEYEKNYGPVLAYGSSCHNDKGYAWVLEPFPWETEE